MASDSNTSFHRGFIPSSSVLATRSATRMVPVPVPVSSPPTMVPARMPSVNLLLDPIPGLKHDTGLAVDWSYDEQAILKEGLSKYVDEPNVMKYVKIAAMLHDKTVRDVALRCRWMSKKEGGKRRKPDDYYAGKKIKDKKDNVEDSSLKTSMLQVSPDNLAAYQLMMPHINQYSKFSYEVPAVDPATRNLLEENAQVLGQISSNLAILKLHDNVNLFCHTRNNITTILKSMSQMPGIMSRMPPLPILVNENLLDTLLPGTSVGILFGNTW